MSEGAKLTPTSQMTNVADPIYSHATGTLRWLDALEGKPFREFIENWLRAEETMLKRSVDLNYMLRAQGAVLVLERIKNLRAELLAAQKSKTA